MSSLKAFFSICYGHSDHAQPVQKPDSRPRHKRTPSSSSPPSSSPPSSSSSSSSSTSSSASSQSSLPRKVRTNSSTPKRLSFTDIEELGSPEELWSALIGSNLQAFTLAEMKAVTRNFSMSSILGSGGFGRVYKGYIDDKLRPGVLEAQQVAVKSLDLDGTQGHKEWLAEVVILGQLRHPHLVKLIGFCCEKEQRMLVYEYMPRGSLENHLFKCILDPLPWITRLKIAIGAAKGLAFLHECEKPVIYRDFKASNILLDSDYKAELSDFGLAKDGPQGDVTHVSTRIMGTHGYACPEYVMTGHLTPKSDVYSFGVVLLELLTGRRSVDKTRPEREKDLVDWARGLLNKPHRLSRLMDQNLNGQYSTEGSQRAAAIAYKCLSHSPKSRPSARAVVEALEPLLELDDMPFGTFVYVVPLEECDYDTKKNKNDDDDEADKTRPRHERRHRKLFPSSAIHSEFNLHRDGNTLFKNSLLSRQSSRRRDQN